MKAYSLRLRLLGGAIVAIFVALSLAWLAMTLIFSRHVQRQFEQDLRRSATTLVASARQDPGETLEVERGPDDPRFLTPASGLYWQVSTHRATVRSRSLWDQELDRRSAAGPADWTSRVIRGPFERGVLVVERRIRISATGEPVLFQVAGNDVELFRARRGFGRELGGFLALLWIVLSAAAWVQVNAGLRPLRRLGTEVAGLRRRPEERLSSNHPSEVIPLIDAINALADARETDVRRARQRAADLAHAMKTPIAALSAQSRQLAQGGDATTDGLDRAIASVASAVEAELARARAAASRQAARSAFARPAHVCRQLVAVLERTDKGMRTDFVIDLPEDFRLRLDETDLTEILGALLENATRHARRAVHVTGGPIADGGRIAIDDDGTGLTPEEIERVIGRGIRLDERGTGHGLGMSIARELAEATEGTLTLARADLGGLRAELVWRD